MCETIIIAGLARLASTFFKQKVGKLCTSTP
uniref:Uncharacterized protein n=1 Tax=Anguilla anguilla TaxID=7936 RepID=A0A0E9QA32_ANGAN